MRGGRIIDRELRRLQFGQQRLQVGQRRIQQQLRQLRQQQQQLQQQMQQMQLQGLQQLQLIQQQLQQIQGQMQGQQGIAEARAMAARALNATLALNAPLGQVPITAGAAHLVGTVPPNYPATGNALLDLTGPEATALLLAYGRPTAGSRDAKIQRLANHLGVQYHA
ncbi:hypothetical protein CHLRE_17g711600v5 [Chlamydomonas reinhardtii]|uniref:Uncharacterized protein n=1 Tax=Chlamydomonas reinhardtii TaxID=3055 RepID=A0A2K3CPL9_CHLRE|nr:uncharacterized protein CHLRE_17g711600v5 [Chlamydomonas reinhardtii]PNW70241.1 hypothetical protein CHLRE_17g711600v5 [Chlamydomonas reinhardtii]